MAPTHSELLDRPQRLPRRPREARRVRETAIRFTLGALLAFAALNAFAGGIYGLSGAEDVPTDWLAGTPFSTYLVPSLILLVVVGGGFLVAAVAVLAGWREARRFAVAAVAIVAGWLAVELALIGYVSWMQPVTALVALLILALALAWRPTGRPWRAG